VKWIEGEKNGLGLTLVVFPFFFDTRSDNADEGPPTESGTHALEELFSRLLQDGRQPPADAERPGPA